MALASEYFLKRKGTVESKFLISMNYCNKNSCYEHITVGVNIYLYGVSILAPECVVCLCVCVSVCLWDQIKKKHYVSNLSKLIVCIPTFCWGEWVEPPTKFKKRGGAWQDLNFRVGLLRKRGVTFFRGCCSFYKKNN